MGLLRGVTGLVSGVLGTVTGLLSAVVRGVLALVLALLGTVLLLVGIVLCLTVLLLPLGIPVVVIALSFYSRAAKLLVPGSTRVEGLVRRAEDSVRGGGSRLRRRLHPG
ncbi:hypothetical protein LWC33_05605 [Pseudonocardia sp. RS11V-5]|uniref:hypothetical protein n=1 Tax=Pseudonocardia terrae TaxID=2905831 RepID=UPI001E38F6C5|nr:hypothetical protein [Pseudonocardia terrae]MCE3550932.1 hypothetical protein [Pseudonocardia terrae]